MAVYYQGSDLPDLEITWNDDDDVVIDFSSGYTFELRVGKAGQAAEFSKTTGITGASTAPNLTVVWADTELDSLEPGTWTLQVRATRTSDSKIRTMQSSLAVLPAVQAPA